MGRLLAQLAWVAPWLLVAVALLQIWKVEREAMSPWKGGGFGMFASTDVPSARTVRASAADGTPLPIPRELDRLRLRARAHPSDGNLRELGEALDAPLPLRVEVLRLELDLDAPARRQTLLRGAEIPGGG